MRTNLENLKANLKQQEEHRYFLKDLLIFELTTYQDSNAGDQVQSLQEALSNANLRLKKEIKTRSVLQSSVKQLEAELLEFKKRMVDLLSLLERKNLTNAADHFLRM